MKTIALPADLVSDIYAVVQMLSELAEACIEDAALDRDKTTYTTIHGDTLTLGDLLDSAELIQTSLRSNAQGACVL